MTSRSDLPPTWDERATLATFLEYARAWARAKCEGLSDHDAAKAPLTDSPLMTMAGIVNHLRWVEHWWFEVVFLGQEDRGPWTDEDPDREFRVAVEMPLSQVLAEYEDQARAIDEAIAGTDLDTMSQRTIRNGSTVPLRWVMFHLIEETSRHNGHLDIVRELVDGTKGS